MLFMLSRKQAEKQRGEEGDARESATVQSGLVLQKENGRIRRTVNVISGQRQRAKKGGTEQCESFSELK